MVTFTKYRLGYHRSYSELTVIEEWGYLGSDTIAVVLFTLAGALMGGVVCIAAVTLSKKMHKRLSAVVILIFGIVLLAMSALGFAVFGIKHPI